MGNIVRIHQITYRKHEKDVDDKKIKWCKNIAKKRCWGAVCFLLSEGSHVIGVASAENEIKGWLLMNKSLNILW